MCFNHTLTHFYFHMSSLNKARNLYDFNCFESSFKFAAVYVVILCQFWDQTHTSTAFISYSYTFTFTMKAATFNISSRYCSIAYQAMRLTITAQLLCMNSACWAVHASCNATFSFLTCLLQWLLSTNHHACCNVSTAWFSVSHNWFKIHFASLVKWCEFT